MKRMAAIGVAIVCAAFVWGCSQQAGKTYNEGTSGAIFGPNRNDR